MKYICSLFALYCVINISCVPATLFNVKQAFDQNVKKHLNGYENSILRNCSYLNQINTTAKLCMIAYKNEDFSDAIDEVVKIISKRTKKAGCTLTNSDPGDIVDDFDKLSKPYQVAAVYSLYFLTNFMNDKDGSNSEDWIDTFMSKYEEEENGVKDLVSSLKGSDLVAIVDNYYRDDKAVSDLKTLWSLDIVKGKDVNKEEMLETFDFINMCEYYSVCESFRKVDKSAAIKEIRNIYHDVEVVCSGDTFDILSDDVVLSCLFGQEPSRSMYINICDSRLINEYGLTRKSISMSENRDYSMLNSLLDTELPISWESARDKMDFIEGRAADFLGMAEKMIKHCLGEATELEDRQKKILVNSKMFVNAFEKRAFDNILKSFFEKLYKRCINILTGDVLQIKTMLLTKNIPSKDFGELITFLEDSKEKLSDLSEIGIELDFTLYNDVLNRCEIHQKNLETRENLYEEIAELKEEIASGEYSVEEFFKEDSLSEVKDKLKELVEDFEDIIKKNEKLGSNAISVIALKVAFEKRKKQVEKFLDKNIEETEKLIKETENKLTEGGDLGEDTLSHLTSVDGLKGAMAEIIEMLFDVDLCMHPLKGSEEGEYEAEYKEELTSLEKLQKELQDRKELVKKKMKELDVWEIEEVREQEILWGREVGAKRAKLVIATNLINIGLSVEQISIVTRLSKEEMEERKDKIIETIGDMKKLIKNTKENFYNYVDLGEEMLSRQTMVDWLKDAMHVLDCILFRVNLGIHLHKGSQEAEYEAEYKEELTSLEKTQKELQHRKGVVKKRMRELDAWGIEEDIEQVRNEGARQGGEKGVKTAKLETAKNLINIGLSVEQISIVTNLSKEEIEKLR